ncbi:ABC transporter ATP-binding protein [bacterium]|nr:MAG: ABC transporter ATP-binding protein [bacterium]RKZ18105.1 MAG: ABC transporter ATP-binding protein [bacterium]
MKYGYIRRVDHSVDAAIERVTAELAERGFGVLTTIDVKATLKKKLDVERPPYVILGACNPGFAHQALGLELELGLLLPCNVIVYTGENDETLVAAIDAKAMLSIAGNAQLETVADEVNRLLHEAVDAV